MEHSTFSLDPWDSYFFSAKKKIKCILESSFVLSSWDESFKSLLEHEVDSWIPGKWLVTKRRNGEYMIWSQVKPVKVLLVPLICMTSVNSTFCDLFFLSNGGLAFIRVCGKIVCMDRSETLSRTSVERIHYNHCKGMLRKWPSVKNKIDSFVFFSGFFLSLQNLLCSSFSFFIFTFPVVL